MKVVFIAGQGRSGSTMLGAVLGSAEGVAYMGELRQLWTPGVVENSLCGCGHPVKQCEVWNQILQRAFGGAERPPSLDLLAPNGRMEKLLFLSRAGRARSPQSTAILERLFSAIQNATNSYVIVDSSKTSTYGVLLAGLIGIPVYAIELVRDARAVAYSETRKKLRTDRLDENQMGPYTAFNSARRWMATNFMTRRMKFEKELFLKYETFARDPQGVTRQIFDFIGEPELDGGFESQSVVKMKMNHTVSGNPDRLGYQGNVRVRLDEQWQAHMPLSGKITVTALTWPFLLHYGYPLLWPRSSLIRKAALSRSHARLKRY